MNSTTAGTIKGMSPEQIDYLRDTLAPDGHTVSPDGQISAAALDVLGSLAEDDDGHYDGHLIWIGGTEYTVEPPTGSVIYRATFHTKATVTVLIEVPGDVPEYEREEWAADHGHDLASEHIETWGSHEPVLLDISLDGIGAESAEPVTG